MKRTLFIGLLGLAAGMTACQKDPASMQPISGATLTVTVPQEISTRAIADYGRGEHVDRCILEIYHDGELYGDRQIASVAGGKATFSDLRLVASQEYDFVLWADCSDNMNDKHYNTANLSAITVNGAYTGNNDEFDAFCASETFTVTESFSENITLTRPFGQLNVTTNDMAEILKEDLKPSQVEVAFAAVPTTFNVLTGEAGGDAQPLSYTTTLENAATGELTVDYIWAAAEQSDLVDFTMTFMDNAGAVIATNDSFTNIPVRRNYRTNVSGNLITKQGGFDVTINPEFTDPDYYCWDLISAAANGGNVTLQGDMIFTEDMPALVVAPGKTLVVDLNGYTIESKVANQDAIMVNGGTLIVNGDGEVKATGNGSNYAVWAIGDSNVTINGGRYQGNGACIQAKDNAHVEINDGYFRVTAPYNGVYFVINLQDNQPNTITVNGGQFENCNPADTNTEPAGVSDNFVAEGYSAVKISDEPAPNGLYEVVKGVGVADMEDLVAAIETVGANGGEITIVESANIDLTPMNAAFEISKPTTLTVNGTLTASVESVYLLNNSELTLQGDGAVHMARRVVENHGTLVVNGGHYSTTVNNGGTAFWNNDPNAVMTLNDVNVEASFFAVAGDGEIHINGGSISSTSSNKYGSWAYCVRAQSGSIMTIKDAVIEGVQGALASIDGSYVTVENSNISARNSEPGRQDAFYALYAASLGVIEVISGDFYSDRTPCAYASDDDVAGAPLGGFVLKGGRYSSYPKHDDGSVWQPEAGYQYEETGDATYPYAIVMQ